MNETNNCCEKMYFSYTFIHELVKKEADVVKEQFVPDVIVAIGGGGFIPARILRTFLKIPLLAVCVELYTEKDVARDHPTKTQWLDETSGALKRIEGKRVIVVDEVDDSRLTLQYVVEQLQTHNPESIAVMVIHNKLKTKKGSLSDNIPYFKCMDVPDRWLCYPWDALDIKSHEAKSKEQNEEK